MNKSILLLSVLGLTLSTFDSTPTMAMPINTAGAARLAEPSLVELVVFRRSGGFVHRGGFAGPRGGFAYHRTT